jgi:hypothetical protein
MNGGVTLCSSILKGLYHSAQGCELRATLGLRRVGAHNPERVASSKPFKAVNPTYPVRRMTVIQPFQGWRVVSVGSPRVARGSQPWAERFNPFGIVATRQMRKRSSLNERSAAWS